MPEDESSSSAAAEQLLGNDESAESWAKTKKEKEGKNEKNTVEDLYSFP